jgi:hypothetical protein
MESSARDGHKQNFNLKGSNSPSVKKKKKKNGKSEYIEE